jgi:release factor glutamine methyltransferase
MEIRANNLGAVKSYFSEKLSDIYPQDEIKSFFEISVFHLLKLTRTQILIELNKSLSESELLKFVAVVKQLKTQKPIQYIFNAAPFYGMELYVDNHVLIPRPETEELVQLVLKTLQNDGQFSLLYSNGGFGLNITDIGTGSGCIALAIKNNLPKAHVAAVDTSYEALKVAQKNADKLKLKITFVCADITRDYSKNLGYHIIISNPPYVTRDEQSLMKENVLKFEPHLALFAPEKKPLYFYEKIADFALNNLVQGGYLFFEINQYYGNATRELLVNKGFRDIDLLKDLNNNERMIRCRL